MLLDKLKPTSSAVAAGIIDDPILFLSRFNRVAAGRFAADIERILVTTDHLDTVGGAALHPHFRGEQPVYVPDVLERFANA